MGGEIDYDDIIGCIDNPNFKNCFKDINLKELFGKFIFKNFIVFEENLLIYLYFLI